jgi:hypothetical protein
MPLRSIQSLIAAAAVHPDVVAAQGIFDVIQRVSDLRRERFTGGTMNDVLVLAPWEFGPTAKRLPKPDCWYMTGRFVSHEIV